MLADQLRMISDSLFESNDVVELRYLLGKPWSTWHLASSLHQIGEVIEHGNREHNCYFGANPRVAMGERDGDGVRLARCLFVEWDEVSWPEAYKRMKSARLPEPSLVVWSGGGPHVYWRLRQPIMDLRCWSKYQKAMIRVLNADRCIHDAPRIMRLPGTWNHKRLQYARVLFANQNRYSVDELLYRVRIGKDERREVTPASSVKPKAGMESIYRRAERYLSKCRPAVSGQGGHNQAFSVIRLLVGGFGIRGDEALAMLQGWNARCDPPWTERELKHKIQDAESRLHKKPRSILIAA